MPNTLSVLCVHGVGHGDLDASLQPTWREAITANLKRWQPDLDVDCQFFRYDDLFDHAPLDPVVYGKALAEMLASGVIHGIGDLFGATRGILDVPDQVRWTAGMVAQWASEPDLRGRLRQRLTKAMKDRPYSLVCAHSLGSLLCYDTFQRDDTTIAGKAFLTFGSQIGNPCVRDCFGGRIAPIEKARRWYHLFNRDDHVLTARIKVDAANFSEVLTEFDKAGDILNHDPIFYFNHENTHTRVWPDVAGGKTSQRVSRAFTRIDRAMAPAREAKPAAPDRRALLIGINDYPDPANRLEGCVNDVFLMSAVLQERGFDASEIRIVLNDRATTSNLMERLHWLLDHVPDGGERVLFYSGHGAQMPSYSAFGEVDRLDECLVPYDFDWNPQHAIRDKQFVEFYSQLPYESRFVAIFDCCHSGGLTREGGQKVRGITPPDDIRHRAMEWDAGISRWETRELPDRGRTQDKAKYRLGRGEHLRGIVGRNQKTVFGHLGPFKPVIYEACQEAQLSYEYRDGSTSYGAFTYSLAKVIRHAEAQKQHLTFRQLATRAARELDTLKFKQTPNLDGPRRVIDRRIPWAGPKGRRA